MALHIFPVVVSGALVLSTFVSRDSYRVSLCLPLLNTAINCGGGLETDIGPRGLAD